MWDLEARSLDSVPRFPLELLTVIRVSRFGLHVTILRALGKRLDRCGVTTCKLPVVLSVENRTVNQRRLFDPHENQQLPSATQFSCRHQRAWPKLYCYRVHILPLTPTSNLLLLLLFTINLLLLQPQYVIYESVSIG